jgi:hypothetical protein
MAYKIKTFSILPSNARELERRAEAEGANQSKLVNLALELFFSKGDETSLQQPDQTTGDQTEPLAN